jgi:multisubunit Na+/H+ antiporter MnhG subunit
MYSRLDRAHRALAVILGVVTLASVGVLFAWDAYPRLFPARAHDVLGAFPLAMIAFAYLVYQSAHRPPRKEVLKAILLAVAFLFWAANQLWPDLPQATLFNDIAIALFVLDVFLVMIGWPAASPDESFAETCAESHENK